MKKIRRVIIHCSATPEGRDVTSVDIRRWHINRGWNDIGYHYVIRLDGTLEYGRSPTVQGAHVKGQNEDSLGVCYIGGMRDGEAADTMTQSQEDTMRELMCSLRLVFGDIEFSGHNEYSSKRCPSFNVKERFENF